MQEELSLLSYNDTNLITLCSPKLSPAYFICSKLTFAAAPCIFSAFWTFTYKKEKSFTQKIFRTLMNVIPAFFYIYLFIPFCAIFHGFEELVRPKGELQTLHFIPCYWGNAVVLGRMYRWILSSFRGIDGQYWLISGAKRRRRPVLHFNSSEWWQYSPIYLTQN